MIRIGKIKQKGGVFMKSLKVVLIFIITLLVSNAGRCMADSSDEVIKEVLPLVETYKHRGSYKRAMTLCEKLLNNYPDSSLRPLIKLKIAEIYQEQNDYKKALEIYKEISNEIPDEVFPHFFNSERG